MAKRYLLHKTKLAQFMEHMERLGATVEEPRGDWQVARFRFSGEPPHIVFDNLRNEHYSLENKTVALFEAWHDFYYRKGEDNG